MKLKKFPKALRLAFTLIELLVVISIIAVLASFAMPAMTGVIIKGNQMKLVNDGRQIYLALKMHSGDNDGVFVTGTNNSNKAFRKLLFNGYISTEKPFYVPKSKWCKTDVKVNETIPSGSTEDSLLVAGANHYGYASGLTDQSAPGWPILFDGPNDSNTTEAIYNANDATKGGLWKGRGAVIVYVDGSAKVEKTQPGATTGDFVAISGSTKVLKVDPSTTNPWLTGATLLSPE